jgi:hypothetical protein
MSIPATREQIAAFAVRTMAELFLLVEGNGLCFDVLVREAIEQGEARRFEDDRDDGPAEAAR